MRMTGPMHSPLIQHCASDELWTEDQPDSAKQTRTVAKTKKALVENRISSWKNILKFYIKDVISKLNTDYILYLFKAAKDSLRKVNQK